MKQKLSETGKKADKATDFADMLRNAENFFVQKNNSVSLEDLPKDEQIAIFNKQAEEARINQASRNAKASTHDFKKKIALRTTTLESLKQIMICDLMTGTTHRGKVVFCRIVSKVLVLMSKAVLVEDSTSMTQLAIYGQFDGEELSEGRCLAIMEPFYKIRADGTKGIRVDNLRDIVFDVTSCPQLPSGKVNSCVDRASAEERTREFLVEEPTVGVNRLHKLLIEEGYRIKKKDLQKLKKEVISQQGVADQVSTTQIGPTSILSDRRPEKHRVIYDPQVISYRDLGNEAFKNGNMEGAEKQYTLALEQQKHIKTDPQEGEEGVHLWQLYSNRCAARIRLGKVDKGLKDALASNVCAPADVIKPLLRCAEAMAALGLKKEMKELLEATTDAFPQAAEQVQSKEQALAPTNSILVGRDKRFRSIVEAITHAKTGDEIIVDPGIYRESLCLTKSITIRGSIINNEYAAIQTLEGDNDEAAWATIMVEDQNSIFCAIEGIRPVRFIGLNVVCKGDTEASWHAALIVKGVAIFRNCTMTSSSGPVLASIEPKSRTILQSCAIQGGAQGGILATDTSHFTLEEVHCCGNAACGLELRTGSTATVDGCHFYNNGRQGVMSWCSAGELKMVHSFIHSNSNESGVLVSESKAYINSCWVYGNGGAGIVTQQKGSVSIYKCEVHDNLEGILIQDTGSAMVEQCKVFSNRANGIFVGFDHRASAVIIKNYVYDNQSKGIMIGNLENVVKRDNLEERNCGRPPIFPTTVLRGRTMQQAGLNKKFLKRLGKNKASIKKSLEKDKAYSCFEKLSKNVVEELAESMLQGMRTVINECNFCKASPKENQTFAKCSRCNLVFYCNRKCQKLHWPEHKKVCRDHSVKYPAFLSPNIDIKDQENAKKNL